MIARSPTGPARISSATARGTAGNLVTDAQIAALAIEYDTTVHTVDTNFARFPEVRWENPLRL